jgi:hypothetical protein
MRKSLHEKEGLTSWLRKKLSVVSGGLDAADAEAAAEAARLEAATDAAQRARAQVMQLTS